MNRKCSTVITCPGQTPGLFGDNPVSNYTAELPDTLTFEGFTYPIFDTNNALNGTDTTGNAPPWFAAGCQSFCFSFLSADDAAACAARQAFICAHTPPTGPAPTFFFNTQQSCPFTCPDGTLYVYTVLPGYFVALNQEEADELAQILACDRAIANHVCLGNFTQACAGTLYSSTAQLFGVYPLGVSLVSGQLPPGFFLSQDPAGKTVTLSGTCQTPGSYNFTLMATDPNGNFHVKNYTLNVLGISNINSLPQPTSGRPYSATLQAAGGTAPFTFGTITGLPTGLTLSPSGTISGTVSVHYLGKFSVIFQVTDATGTTCQQTWNSSTKEPPGPDWTTLNWDTYTLVPGIPANFVAGQGSGPNAFGALVLNTNLINPKITPVHGGGVTYTGPQVQANILLVVTDWNAAADLMTFRVMHSVAGQIGGLGLITGPGTYNFNFTVPASVGANITVDDAGASIGEIQANQYAGSPIKLTFTLQLFNL